MENEDYHLDDSIVELLGYDPDNFLDDVINSANTLIYNALSSLQKFVEHEMNGANPETEQGMVKMETLMEQAVDTSFLEFEKQCKEHIFKVPNGLNILLPQYKNLDFQNLDNEHLLDQKIESLKAQIEQLTVSQSKQKLIEPVARSFEPFLLKAKSKLLFNSLHGGEPSQAKLT